MNNTITTSTPLHFINQRYSTAPICCYLNTLGFDHQQQDVVILRAILFWNITQRIVVIPYRRFATTYWSHHVVPKIQKAVTAVRFVISPKSTDLMHFAAEAGKHVFPVTIGVTYICVHQSCRKWYGI